MINLNSVDSQQAKALNRLQELGNDALLKLLQSQADEAKSKLVSATDMVQIHRLQGRVEAFEDLLRAVEESAKVLNRSTP
jgi:histone H3/H4